MLPDDRINRVPLRTLRRGAALVYFNHCLPGEMLPLKCCLSLSTRESQLRTHTVAHHGAGLLAAKLPDKSHANPSLQTVTRSRIEAVEIVVILRPDSRGVICLSNQA